MKKGSTIIELLAVISIVCIIFSFSYKGFNYFSKIKNDMEVNNFITCLESEMYYAKLFCKKKQRTGLITIKTEDCNTELIFTCDGTKEETKFNRVLSVYDEVNNQYIKYESIMINADGYVESKTIKFIDCKEKIYVLTIRPGGNKISINKHYE